MRGKIKRYPWKHTCVCALATSLGLEGLPPREKHVKKKCNLTTNPFGLAVEDKQPRRGSVDGSPPRVPVPCGMGLAFLLVGAGWLDAPEFPWELRSPLPVFASDLRFTITVSDLFFRRVALDISPDGKPNSCRLVQAYRPSLLSATNAERDISSSVTYFGFLLTVTNSGRV